MDEAEKPEKAGENEESKIDAIKGANVVDEKEGKEERQMEVVRVRDPLTYVFWGIMMLIYGGFLIRWGLTYPEANYRVLLYIVQPVVFIVVGLYSIIYGIRRNRRVRVYTLEK